MAMEHDGKGRKWVSLTNTLFPNRVSIDVYDFGVPDDTKWIVNKMESHHWNGRKLEFQVCWNLGETMWELLDLCEELEALDRYLILMGVKEWWQLPKKVAAQAA